jgi:acetyltransferase-like isoleucine patch superfamily enzyme
VILLPVVGSPFIAEGKQNLMMVQGDEYMTIVRTNADRKPAVMLRALRRLGLTLTGLLYPVLPQRVYMAWFISLLRMAGMHIGSPIYIAPDCYFDKTDYGLITIEDQVVISGFVIVLTHDFSLARVRDALAGKPCYPEVALVRGVRIGRNSFIGMRSILMPGTDVGANCIVGAGSVIRGEVPDNSIVVGNPAKVVGNSLEWGRRKLNELGIEKFGPEA